MNKPRLPPPDRCSSPASPRWRFARAWLTASAAALGAVALTSAITVPVRSSAATRTTRKATRPNVARPSTTRRPTPPTKPPVTAPPTTAPVITPKRLLFAVPAVITGRPVKVMAVGDSLTAGTETANQSYRGHLFNKLGADGLSVDFVGSQHTATRAGGDPDHEGHGPFGIGPDDTRFCDWPADGDKQCQEQPFSIAQGIEAWLAASEPDVVLLQVGLYDMFEGTLRRGSSGLEKTFAPEQAPLRYRNLVRQITAARPNVVVIVGTLLQTPWISKGWGPYEALNAEIRKIGDESATDHVIVVDLNKVTLQKLDFQDGFHLSDAAAMKVAEGWFKAADPVIAKLSGRS